MVEKKLIYMDNAATTAPDSRVVEAMLAYMTSAYGNPSSRYSIGYEAKNLINSVRVTAAKLIGAQPEEIYFTANGTEADNIALQSLKLTGKRHLIVSAIEHPAVLNTARQLEKEGFLLSCLKADKNGIIQPEALEAAITPDTGLVSVMFANNEIGSIQPIKKLSEIAHRFGSLFHTDAVQAFGQLRINVSDLGIDYLSASAHKIYGPKGVGLLYARRNVPVKAISYGGGQEYDLRPGTENTAAIAGFGRAIELAAEEMQIRAVNEQKLSVHICNRILREISGVRLNGPEIIDNDFSKRLPGNMNFSFEGVRGISLALRLDMEKICVSTGSACSAGNDRPSHVLSAIGLSDAEANSSIRITIGKNNSPEEADYLVDKIKEIAEEIRQLNNYRI
ncbi:MAG: cysteine desulfurase [Lachnospiraceae bacterium]|nr:cysteine desulfurase [Lachnospiraceae bacterium]